MYQNEMQRIAATDAFKHFHSVLFNAMPSGFPKEVDVSATQAIRMQGRFEGWRDMMNLIDRMIWLQKMDFEEEQDEYQPLTAHIDYGRNSNFKL